MVYGGRDATTATGVTIYWTNIFGVRIHNVYNMRIDWINVYNVRFDWINVYNVRIDWINDVRIDWINVYKCDIWPSIVLWTYGFP